MRLGKETGQKNRLWMSLFDAEVCALSESGIHVVLSLMGPKNSCTCSACSIAVPPPDSSRSSQGRGFFFFLVRNIGEERLLTMEYGVYTKKPGIS